MSCPCVFVSLKPITGGIALGGSVSFYTNKVSGGVALGGTVSGACSGDTFPGMAAYWLLQESESGSTGEVKDATRYALHGTGGAGKPAYCPTREPGGVACRYTQYFDSTDYIALPNDPLIPTQAFSVSCWINLQSRYQGRTWYSRGVESRTGDQWVFSLGNNFLNQLLVQVQDDTGTSLYCTGDTTLTREINYHIAATWQPGVGLSVFLNGVLDGMTTSSSRTLAQQTTGGFLGRFNSGGKMTGLLQDVRLYSTAKDSDWWLAEISNFCDPSFITYI